MRLGCFPAGTERLPILTGPVSFSLPSLYEPVYKSEVRVKLERLVGQGLILFGSGSLGSSAIIGAQKKLANTTPHDLAGLVTGIHHVPKPKSPFLWPLFYFLSFFEQVGTIPFFYLVG